MPLGPGLPDPMIGSFSFAGVSALNYGLVCKSVTRSILPPVKFRRVEFATASGAYDLESKHYELRNIAVKIQYFGAEEYLNGESSDPELPVYTIKDGLTPSFIELHQRARKIAAWLGKSNWSRLTFFDEPNYYYLAKVDGAVEINFPLQDIPLAEADINFVCQPYLYTKLGDNPIL